MRIAYMLTSLGIGGAEKQAIAIGERMAARGHDVALIVLKSLEEREWPTRLYVHRLGMKKSLPGMLRGLAGAQGFLRSFKPDLLHSHTFPANMMARSLYAMGGVPIVVSTIHNVYEGGWHRTLAYRMTDPLSHYTTAVSHAVADRSVRAGAVDRARCSVITNGVDTELFSPSKRASSDPQRPAKLVWLAAGRDVAAKDFDNLIAAFRIVRETSSGVELWIAGNPASHRKVEVGATGVRWLGLCDDMPRVLSSCDAFVLSSAWEGMPLVIGEAMAVGKPIVATDVGGVRELVGEFGFLVPPKSPQALADAMLRVMRMSKRERGSLGAGARSRIVQHFDMQTKANEWESLYTRILCDHR